MNRTFQIIATVLFTFSVCPPLIADHDKPNVIVIYTDDQGFGDISALNPNCKFQTPNLDRLANEGIAFTNAHSPDSVCTPSRYGLLTGRYAWRTHLKQGVFGAENACLIEDGRLTLASLLKENGYDTAMVGKWHLGMDFPGTAANRDWSQPVRDMPLDKGFDYFYGVPASLNFGVLAWFEGRHAKVPPTQYTSKKPNARHVDYRIMPPYHDAVEGKKPKGGLEVAPDFIDNQCLTRFTDKAIEWMGRKVNDAQEGEPFFLYLPYTSPHYPVCPLPEFHGQGQSGTYGEFVIETDHHVGRILRFLEESLLDQNTLIIFTSDNGPEKSWAGRIKEFGHDSRGGFREGKRSVYEGGHRVPFLVRWPAGIKQPGRTWDGIVGQTDLLATLSEIVGAPLPNNAGEDSQSFASVLKDPNDEYQRVPLINHGVGTGSNAVRFSITDDVWKLVLGNAKNNAELYDLANDPAETNNVASKHHARVQSLTKRVSQIVVSGRSTPGKHQSNDTGYWNDLTWMTAAEYAAIENGFTPDRTVTYKTVGDTELKLHVFEPAEHQQSDEAAAIVFFFGGGWNGGNPNQFFQQARELADQGMVAFSADYRVRSRNNTTPFECVMDAKSAVRWIRTHAGELGIDPNRIVASGGSAGGHIAACTGVIRGVEEDNEDLSISSIPNAMILYNPVLDTTAKGYGLSKVGDALRTDISPCHHVRPGIVPTLLLHGTDDKTVPFENAERFARLMNEAGNVCQLESFEDQGHGFFNSSFFRPQTKDKSVYAEVMAKTRSFLDSQGYLRF